MDHSNIRTFCVASKDRNVRSDFCSNYVSTTKYSLSTFLPRSLIEQFMRVMNIYFLVTAVLQSIPEISPLHPFSAIAPLMFVLVISIAREGVEDFLRYRSDCQTNSARTRLYKGGKFTKTTAKELQVGDLILIHKDEVFPCDLILLSCSQDSGLSFIETSSLDGEKTLKPRYVMKPTSHLYKDQQSFEFYSKVVCEQPNPQLYSFNGNIQTDDGKFPVDKSHVLLAGAVLRNTEWALGIATYTGNDCKLRQNLCGRRFKQSRVEKQVNKFIVFIIIIQMALCSFCALKAGVWTHQEWHKHWYLSNKEYEPWLQGLLNFFTYFLLLNTMIPISLIVSLEIVKVGQGVFMQFDRELYSEVRDRPCKVSSCSLNEELGMIGHVFTDKTGTLTCNHMEFKMCTVGLSSYSVETEGDLNDLMSDLHSNDLLDLFLKCMSLCHECLVDVDPLGNSYYVGKSPDEVAILTTAKRLGYEFLGTSNGLIELKVKNSQLFQFELVCCLEFDSDRKRSSVIVTDKFTGKSCLFIKGADSVINPLLSASNNQQMIKKIRQDLHMYAKKGYRTLMLGFKSLSDREFHVWKSMFEKASRSIENRDTLLEEAAAEIEQDIMLLGCTAVEDALQDQVAETIEAIHKAGIKVWMLTGDKLETAENIGRTCNFITEEMIVQYCRGDSLEETYSSLVRIKSVFESSARQKSFGLIVEGSAIQFILAAVAVSEPDTYKHLTLIAKLAFLKLAKICKTVICCRMTPGQKREIVHIIRHEFGEVSLAIGDGANDVSMILEADIGIGLYGQEGMQSVQASDYAIGEFKYLWELLFVHGRLNYLRQSEMIMYFFYKNVVFTIPQFFFAFYSAFSGQTVYDDWYITFYNMVFTALPLLVRGLYDADMVVPKRSNFKAAAVRSFVPLTYKDSRQNKAFGWGQLFLWLLDGVFHSMIVFYVLLAASIEGLLNSEGKNHDLWSFSITSFTAVMLIVTLKICLLIRVWNYLHFLSIFVFSLTFYFAFIAMLDNLISTNSVSGIHTITDSPYFCIGVYAAVAIVFCVDGGVHLYRRIVFPTLAEKLNEVSKKPRAKTDGNTRTVEDSIMKYPRLKM